MDDNVLAKPQWAPWTSRPTSSILQPLSTLRPSCTWAATCMPTEPLCSQTLPAPFLGFNSRW